MQVSSYTKWLCYAVILCYLQAVHDERTSGTIEGWNYILKRTDHVVHRQRPDVFLRAHFPVITGRQLQYLDNLRPQIHSQITVRNATV